MSWRWKITFGRSSWSALGGWFPYPYAHVLRGSVVVRVFRFLFPKRRAIRLLNRVLIVRPGEDPEAMNLGELEQTQKEHSLQRLQEGESEKKGGGG